MAVWYAEEVAAGRVPACKEETQACIRFLTMRKMAQSGTLDYTWSDAHVIDACSFVEKLPHTKAFTGTITLEPVQCWWIANIFGFREKTTGLRWIRTVSFWVPRKNTKSTLAVGVVLYCLLCEDEPGAEATISAGSEGQAQIPYGMIRKTFEIDQDLKDFYGVHDTRDYTEFRRAGGAKINLATAKAKNLDGLNPHVVLAEELHAQSQDVIGVLRTAMGSRSNPLWISISTAGRDTNSPAYEEWRAVQAVLEGRMRAERMFAVIYTASKEDAEKRFDLRVIEKVNPMWGVSLNPAAIEEEIIEAKKSESKLNEYKRTRINVWSRAAGNLLSVEAWRECADKRLQLAAFKGYPLFVGIDLASRSDLNAASYETIVDGQNFFCADYWLPEKAQRMEDDRFADAFIQWAKEGYLTLTPGGYIDYKVILRRVLERIAGHNVIGVGLDDYQANLMASEIEEAGYTCFIVPKNAKNLTASTEDLIARHNDPKLFQHDGNPVSEWCAGNVVGHWDSNDNVLPKKERKGSRANIDGIDAKIISGALRIDWEAGVLGSREGSTKTMPNPYLNRGLAGAA